MKCRVCGEENDSTAKFCASCGTALVVTCPECGAELEAGAKYCNQCGSLSPFYTEGRDPTLGSPADRLGKGIRADQMLEGRVQVSPSSDSSPPSRAERKLVTIFFSDIVGSTPISGDLGPEEWREVVDGAHRRVSQAIGRYGGTIAQLLGDGVLAFFGAPVAHEDDAIRAVRAALDLQKAIGEYREELAGWVDGFYMRVGIHTGRVVVGEVGGESHREYLAVGQPASIASRLQGRCEPGGVLLSEATAKLAEGYFELDAVGPLSLKGVAGPMNSFQVKGVKPSPVSPRGLPGIMTPLVGRQHELDRLLEAVSALGKGRGQVAVVTGEAGIGKTRIAQEVRGRAMATSARPIRWLEARALSYGENLSFWAIRQLLLSDLGLSDGDSAIRVGAALKRSIQERFGSEAPNVEPFLLDLMGAPLEGEWVDRIHQLDGEVRRYQTINALGAYFEKTSEQRPTVALFEDAHWLDPSSLVAVEELLALTDRVPLMVLLLMRIERQHGSWNLRQKMESDYPHRFVEVGLKALSTEESSDLASSLLSSGDADPRLRALLLERASGNPFYLEELVRDLTERGLVIQGSEGLQLADEGPGISIPRTVEGVLTGRIDRLPDRDRRVLQLASVIGESFLLRILVAVCAEESLNAEPSLARLLRADFVHEATFLPEREYAFRHSLTQQAAYNTLLEEQRRVVHHRVGEAIELLFPDQQEEYLGLLAHHFGSAGEGDKALRYLLEAGDRARLREELPEAAANYHGALPFLTEAEDWDGASKTWLKLGLVHQASLDFKAAHEANEMAFELAERRDQLFAGNQGRKRRSAEVTAGTTLRVGLSENLVTLDPGKPHNVQDMRIILQVFAGLTELDSENNVVPYLSRSWEVIEGGRRYVFHLRNDARWTDGHQVTAHDFEWAWKRNLNPETESPHAVFLDPIQGARAFRQGITSDPDSVGVRALDSRTLEVRLEAPSAHFLYLTALPISLPLPQWQIDRVGDTWWHPVSIVSNGPFCLEDMGEERLRLARNEAFFGQFSGDIEFVDYRVIRDEADRLNNYIAGRVDVITGRDWERVPSEVRVHEGLNPRPLSTLALMLQPTRPPLDNVLVRRALAHTYDRMAFRSVMGGTNMISATGGLVPVGMAGHSPGLALDFDPDLGRQLLAEAGYPGGAGLPKLKVPSLKHGYYSVMYAEMAERWHDLLGMDIARVDVPDFANRAYLDSLRDCDVLVMGWASPFPDPDNFLRQSGIYSILRASGWEDDDYEEIGRRASQSASPTERMALYRQADRYLVAEQALVVPISYGVFFFLIKPWIRSYLVNGAAIPALKRVKLGPVVDAD